MTRTRTQTWSAGWRAAGERGGATVELVLVTPLLLLILLLVVAAGRLATAQAEVDGAARDAARAASIQRSPAAAARAADQAAAASLGQGRITCLTSQVHADLGAFRAGGQVTVEVGCTVGLGDLTLLRLGGSRTLSARFAHPVDLHRGIQP